MNSFAVRLFGQFGAECSGKPLRGLDSGKAHELFCYLLLHRSRPHHREALAELLWNDASAPQSKKYLRQALWHVNSALCAHVDAAGVHLVLAGPEWICINPHADLWIDVTVFEAACDSVREVAGPALDSSQAQALIDAAALYRGDLLEGCYLDWCLFERERLFGLHLAVLDKLMDYCEARGRYEAAISYGNRVLQHDQARECTHRRLMRLNYLAGNRTEALRQYGRCAETLQQELGVKPAASTAALYAQIRSGRPLGEPFPSRVIQRLEHVLVLLADAQTELRREIAELESTHIG